MAKRDLWRLWQLAASLAFSFWLREGEFLLADGSLDKVPQLAELTFHLRDPLFLNGSLETCSGGVVVGEGLRLQAQKIRYLFEEQEKKLLAEGEVRLEWNGHLLIGRSLEYNLVTREGSLWEGRTDHYPWFFGGDCLQLLADGSCHLYQGYLTTSEERPPLWRLAMREGSYFPDGRIAAKGVTLYLGHKPLFGVPSLSTHLSSIQDNPIRYTMRWGGQQGARLGMAYEFFATEHLRSFIRFDYNFKRGPGAGMEVHYANPWRAERFDAINYVARDITPTNSHLNTRYRVQGSYRRLWCDNVGVERSSLEIGYDKLSDQDMATDYVDRGLELEIARRTQLFYWYRGENWISHVTVRPRINSFQTINQELPTLSLRSLPYRLFGSKWKSPIGDTAIQASYLDFKYANAVRNVDDYTAIRLSLLQRFYLPLRSTWGELTPEGAWSSIFYGNAPTGGFRWLQQASFRLSGHLLAEGKFFSMDHLVRPYFQYQLSSFPSVDPDDHFIFSIEDGLFRAQLLRLGVRHYLLLPSLGCASPLYFLDCYLDGLGGFYKKAKPVPRLHLELEYQPLPRLRNRLDLAWDLQHGGWAHLIYSSEWTVSDRLAIALEYRQRNSFEWRKAQRENDYLDFFHPQEELLQTQLSDRHRTLLLHFFWKLNYNIALEWQSRAGWERRHEPAYFEYDVNLRWTLPARWRMKISYQHKEYEDRLAVYFDMGTPPPRPCRPAPSWRHR